jgi:UPF0755 protein
VRRILGTLALVTLAAALAAGGAAFWAWREVTAFAGTPHGSEAEKVVEVPQGASARAVIRALAAADVLADERLATWLVRFVEKDPRPFRAGEYAFDGPLTPREVLARLRKGEVKLYRFTVPEGLRADEIAVIVGRSGLADEAAFLGVARDPAVARALSLPFASLEGFLYPDTYAFARGVSARRIAEAMVERFKAEYAAADAARDPAVKLDLGETAVLASIVEKETGQVEERPRIACVFHNRLRTGMRLQTDPTVMYATYLRTGRWSRNISRADLTTPHPYNTYTTAGLPPGPIASAGGAAIRAALAPAACDDLFFVSRNDGTHVFCPDLACHAAAVRTWQVEFFRKTPRGRVTPAGESRAADRARR